MDILKDWYQRYAKDTQLVILSLFVIIGFAVVLTIGDMLAPVLCSIVLAYLLDSFAVLLQRFGLRRRWAVAVSFSLFLGVLVCLFVVVLPLIWSQALALGDQLPAMVDKGRGLLLRLTELYPNLFSPEKLTQLFAPLTQNIQKFGEFIVSFALSTFPNLLAFCVYLILIPLLVFFFLKDKQKISDWFSRNLPSDSQLALRVKNELDSQMGQYVKGKFVEILIVAAVSYVVFLFLGLKFAALLAMIVGLSVVVPYVGAAVVTIPVAMVAFFQWGWGAEFGWVVFAYGVIQALDGNLLAPLLFSEAVNLHPVVIIIAIILFGGLWGFWGGVFCDSFGGFVSGFV